MRWSAGIIVCLLFACTCLQAQRTRYGLIKGTVMDSLTHRPLEAATVSVLLTSDSSLVNYALTTRRGEFTTTNIPLNVSCSLVVSHSGYKDFTQSFTLLPDKREWKLDTIYLEKVFNELQAVTITAQRPPVSVRQDTLEFNVSSFKTMPNSMVEDLLKLLPGVELDRNGNITINGKKVTKVLVDGREFFGGDPKIAIKNLPKDVIEKLQVMDNKTREARFNKTTTGNEDLAINLTLRKDVQKGWFGRASAGYGSNERYEAGAMLNFFSRSKQINFIGSANNTNRGGISGDDFSISGRSTLDGGGGGLARTKAGGLNFSDNLGKQIKLNSSYFYTSSHNDYFSRLQRRNILPDTSFFYNADNNNAGNYTNHRLSLNAQYTIDSLTELHLNANVSLTRGNTVTNNEAVSTGLEGQLINTSKNSVSSVSDGKNITTELFFSRRFRKQGRGFTLGVNYNLNDQLSKNENTGANVFYKNGVLDSRDSVDQQSFIKNPGNVIAVVATYSEPVAKNLTALVRYNYNRNLNWSHKITNRFNNATGKYDIEDSAFTNVFRNLNEAHLPDLSMVYHNDKFRASAGSGIQFLMQDNYSVTTNTLLHQYYITITPSANVGYNFSKTGNINIYYNGQSQQPSIQQLQPVPDNSIPLYVQLGNPDLKPAFFHNINLQVRKSNGSTYWFTSLNFNTTQNQIINETYFDDAGRQVSQPVNINGNYAMLGNAQYSYTWKKTDWSLHMNLGTNSHFSRNTSYINKVRTLTSSFSISESAGLNFTYKQVLSLMPAFSIRYNKTLYSSQSVPNAEFNTKAFSLTAFWNRPKWLIVENSMQYNYNSQVAPGFKKGVTMWSAALSWLLFKKQQGIVRLAVYDILKQNAGITRSITQTYIEDRQAQVLQRYFMMSFIYNFRKLNVK